MKALLNYPTIKTLDMHTGGEPLRIVIDGFPKLSGRTILEKRREMQNDFDVYRKYVMWEPRGHFDMYGLIKVPAERADSEFGVLFMHNAGYSTMCGHASIAVGRAAVDLGWVEVEEPLTSFKIDAPCGQITLYVKVTDGEVQSVSFDNVPSFLVGAYELNNDKIGKLNYDLAYGGAFYAYVNASDIGLSCDSSSYADIVKIGRYLKKEISRSNTDIRHPESIDLSFLYGVIFIEPSGKPGVHSRNVCVFADGEVDRCSTGSGISGRAAIHFHRGEILKNQPVTIESITGSVLEVEIIDVRNYGQFEAIIPRVSGMAYYTGSHEFWVDANDPLSKGFLLS